jgi:hypothetical protein
MPERSPAETIVTERLASYCERIDSRRLPQLEEVFAPDCHVCFGSVALTSFDELVDFLRSGLARFEATQHIVSDILVEEANERRIRSLSRVRAWHRFTQPRPDLTIFGQYRDELIHTPSGWRITEHIGSELGRESPSLPLPRTTKPGR